MAGLEQAVAAMVWLWERQRNEGRNNSPHPRDGIAPYMVDIMKKMKATKAKINYVDKGKRKWSMILRASFFVRADNGRHVL